MKKKNSIFHFIRVYFSFSGLISYEKKKTHYEHISIERIWRIKIEGDKKKWYNKANNRRSKDKKSQLDVFCRKYEEMSFDKMTSEWIQVMFCLCFYNKIWRRQKKSIYYSRWWDS